MTLQASPAARDPFVLYGETFDSRLLLGTARYPSPATLQAAVEASHPAMLTVALRRRAPSATARAAMPSGRCSSLAVPVLPNTAGCLAPQEAITTAMMAREVFETD